MGLLTPLSQTRPAVGLHVVDQGILPLAVAEMRRHPLEFFADWTRDATGLAYAVPGLLTVINGPGLEQFPPCPGLFEMLLNVLKSYEGLNSPETGAPGLLCIVGALQNGGFCKHLPECADQVKAAASSIRYLLDHPMAWSFELGATTSLFAVRWLARSIAHPRPAL